MRNGHSGNNTGVDPGRPEFWRNEAADLKQAADMCWDADLSTMQRLKVLRHYAVDTSMLHTVEGAEAELNLLYRYLIALAIQYLAIAILIARDPQHFLSELPGHHIVSLIDACGANLSTAQRRLLTAIEHAYEWEERYPQLGGKLADTGMRLTTQAMAGPDAISQAGKEALDGVYDALSEMLTTEYR